MDDMFFVPGGDIPVDRFIAPRVEVELAFVLGRPARGPGRRRSTTCSPRPITSFRRSRSSTRASSSSTARPRRRARCSTPSPTSPPTPASCSGRRAGPPTGHRPALGRRHARQERRDRGDGACRRRAQPSRDRRGLARQQDRAATVSRSRAGDVVLAGSFTRPTAGGRRRPLPRRLRPARRDRIPLRLKGGVMSAPDRHVPARFTPEEWKARVRARGRVPHLRLPGLDRAHLQPHLAAAAGAGDALPDQPVRPALQRGDRIEPREDRPGRQHHRRVEVADQSGRVHAARDDPRAHSRARTASCTRTRRPAWRSRASRTGCR